MSDQAGYDWRPVGQDGLQPARYFAANFAGEHIAGTEFVIGAAFVAWGVSAGDLVVGLLIGNLLAVLSWTLICAPIAVRTRLTLYAYLHKIAGSGFVKLYSVVNGLLFCILAGSMITVSASAVRIPLGVPAQTEFLPTDFRFVLTACAVGAVVVTVAVLGFRRLAQFAGAVTPWMIAMFLVGALTTYPVLATAAGVEAPLSLSGFWQVAESEVWSGDPDSRFTAWHVGAFAWIANLAMHAGMSDMSLLRFSPRASYGLFSAIGMFIGHFLAWIWAGLMGAGAALLLGTTLSALDAGEVAFQALGAAGIVAVVIAGWTTSNPTLYRAGLAFQSLNPAWSRRKVTLVVGVATTMIACFPFVFTRLLDFVGLMGLLLAPVGAVIVTEYWVLPRTGPGRHWLEASGRSFNAAALTAWVGGLLVAWACHMAGLHLYFLLTPAWLGTMAIYAGLVILTVKPATGAAPASDPALDLSARPTARSMPGRAGPARLALRAAILTGLAVCVAIGAYVLLAQPDQVEARLTEAHRWLLAPSALCLAAAAALAFLSRPEEETNRMTDNEMA